MLYIYAYVYFLTHWHCYTLTFFLFLDSDEDLGSDEESGKDWDELEEEARRGKDDKESGWKFCINWPIGGWKKYSPYTFYYLSIVFSQDLDGIFACIFCMTLLYELLITYSKWVIIGAFRMLRNLTVANACTFIRAVFCFDRTMFDTCLEQAKPSISYWTKRNETPPHICHIDKCYIGNAHSVIMHTTHSFHPQWNIWEVLYNIYQIQMSTMDQFLKVILYNDDEILQLWTKTGQ